MVRSLLHLGIPRYQKRSPRMSEVLQTKSERMRINVIDLFRYCSKKSTLKAHSHRGESGSKIVFDVCRFFL